MGIHWVINKTLTNLSRNERTCKKIARKLQGNGSGKKVVVGSRKVQKILKRKCAAV